MSRIESKRLHIIYQALDLIITRARKVIVEKRLDNSLQITYKGRDLRYRIITGPLPKKMPDKPHMRSSAQERSPGFLWLTIRGGSRS